MCLLALAVLLGESPSPLFVPAGMKTGEPLVKVIATFRHKAEVLDAAGVPAMRAHPPQTKFGI
jgi:hypothetical protein